MKNVMVDLETLGLVPGSVILSIGAVVFDAEGLGNQFYQVVSVEDSEAFGLRRDPATMRWWDAQSPEARKVLDDAYASDATDLWRSLSRFNAWLVEQGGAVDSVYLWGNGSNFDNVLLKAAYDACGMEPAWKFYQDRCFRTLKAMCPPFEAPRTGTYHNALDDAITQANYAVQCLRWLDDKQVSPAEPVDLGRVQPGQHG
jgi:exodeoxyribonuclease VIII